MAEKQSKTKDASTDPSAGQDKAEQPAEEWGERQASAETVASGGKEGGPVKPADKTRP